jgi:hypothetical protein
MGSQIYVIDVYFFIILSFSLVIAADLWFSLTERMCKFYACIFDQWPILRCVGLVRHQRQATQLLSMGNDISLVTSYAYKKDG